MVRKELASGRHVIPHSFSCPKQGLTQSDSCDDCIILKDSHPPGHHDRISVLIQQMAQSLRTLARYFRACFRS